MNLNSTIIRSSESSIQSHLRNYYSKIKNTQKFLISELFDSYKQCNPALHQFINSETVDISVLNYCIPRLPGQIHKIKRIIMCQDISQLGNIDISAMETVTSPSRRRLYYYDKINQTLIAIITSDSDIDDLLNCLIAYQIERQKISNLSVNDFNQLLNSDNYRLLNINADSWTKLKSVLGENWKEDLNSFYQYVDIEILPTELNDNLYQSIYTDWWKKVSINSLVFDLANTPLYFVSSNSHSLVNLVSGYANQIQDKIITFIEKNIPDLYLEWQKLKSGDNQLRVIDFLYYISSVYFSKSLQDSISKTNYEQSLGVKTIKPQSNFQCLAQLIPVSTLAKSSYLDPNLTIKNIDIIKNSRSFILNIEYPLGYSAYFLLKELLPILKKLNGVYIIGKAAILTGSVGDIQIPNIVFDERTNNIFYPKNIFNDNFSFSPIKSSILKDQKSISVYGTFLENAQQINNYIESDFNIIEMETGPYLTAIYQHLSNLTEQPHSVISHLDNLPFDTGIINYASDNPLSKNLGESSLALRGVEPTYLATLSVIQRIIDLESIKI